MENSSVVEGYLNESGVNNILKDLVTELCIHKPLLPVPFMINYLKKMQGLLAEQQASSSTRDDEEIEDDSDIHFPEFSAPKSAVKRRERRGAVSSEPPGDVDLSSTPSLSDADLQNRIEEALKKNVLFQHLESSERKEIAKFMAPYQFKQGDTIIKQGDDGDNFYVVDSGECDIYKEKDGVKDLVQHVAAGGSFGELALIYNTSRAATVVASTDVQVLAIGRQLYRQVLMESTIRKRQLYESFLDKVPILANLQKYERLTIADALEPVKFQEGQVIVSQGDPGDVFYIIVSGEARVVQSNADGLEQEIARLGVSDYFGEIALLTNRPRAATVISVNEIECVKLDRDRFNRVLGPCEEILRRNMEAYNRYMANKI